MHTNMVCKEGPIATVPEKRKLYILNVIWKLIFQNYLLVDEVGSSLTVITYYHYYYEWNPTTMHVYFLKSSYCAMFFFFFFCAHIPAIIVLYVWA